jgi:hypothetical protein
METTTPIARYHHRHFVSAQPGKRQDSYHFTFRPFTGYETRPELNVAVYDDSGVSLDDRILLAREYEAARTLWSQAKFRLHAKPAITRAQPIRTSRGDRRLQPSGESGAGGPPRPERALTCQVCASQMSFRVLSV